MHERACVTGILDMFFVRWRVGEEEMGVGEEFLEGIGVVVVVFVTQKNEEMVLGCIFLYVVFVRVCNLVDTRVKLIASFLFAS